MPTTQEFAVAFKGLHLQLEPCAAFFFFCADFSLVYPLPVMTVYLIGAILLAAAAIGLWRLS